MAAFASESKMGFARRLASPKKKTREKAISLLVLWLTSQKQLEEEELKKVWKGLFYCVWHSDKAPVQADLIERLASILEKLDIELALKFFKVFLMTMRREWAGIDRLRLDKFYLLLRKCLGHMLLALQTSGWHADPTNEFMDMFLENVFLAKDPYAALGINLHYADIFLQELKNYLPFGVDTFKLLLEPFLVVCAHALDKSLLQRIKENIFNHLLDVSRLVISAKKEGQPLDPVVEMLGSLALSLPLGSEAFRLASLPSTLQANRKVLYEVHSEYEKLENLLETSGTTLCLSTGAAKKKRKKKKKEKVLEPVGSIAKPIEREAHHKIKSAAFDAGEGMVASIPLKEGSAHSESKEGERSGKVNRREESDSNESKVHEAKGKRKGSSSKRKKVALVGTGTSEEGLRSVSTGLGTDGSVVSKLERQFDMLADESLVNSDVSASPDIKMSKATTPQSTEKKKRKRQTSVGDGDETLVPLLAGEKDNTPTTAVKAEKSSGKVKKVRFALKKNLVWTPSTPLPAENVRVPPSATPRGSALKKGVPPGPIISETVTTWKQRKGTPMRLPMRGKIHKNRKGVVKYVKLLCEQELAKGGKQDFGTLLGGLLK